MDTRLNGTVSTLRIAIGLMATLAGLDKFFNLLTNWEAYVAPATQLLVPFSTTTFMAIVGVIEFVVGITVLVIRPSLGAFVTSAWLVLIAVNLVLGGHFDIAVRDLVLAVSAYALARFEQVRETAPATAPVGRRRTVTA
jgi:uncharacterized membrane protein YphA (DoxX/SURF4 family)